MPRRMPVLGKNDVLEPRRDPLNHRNHRIAVRHRQRPSGAEIILHVDNQKYVLRGDFHAPRGSCSSSLWHTAMTRLGYPGTGLVYRMKAQTPYAASTISIRSRLPTARAARAMV